MQTHTINNAPAYYRVPQGGTMTANNPQSGVVLNTITYPRMYFWIHYDYTNGSTIVIEIARIL
jgi:hypothetical protein